VHAAAVGVGAFRGGFGGAEVVDANGDDVGSGGVLRRRSNRLELATRSGSGTPSRRASQSSGMPSARDRSESSTDWAKAGSRWQPIRKLRFADGGFDAGGGAGFVDDVDGQAQQGDDVALHSGGRVRRACLRRSGAGRAMGNPCVSASRPWIGGSHLTAPRVSD